jgi:hypothetical protein
MQFDKVDKKLVKICRDSGLLVLIYEEGKPDFYAWDHESEHASLIPVDEVHAWTLVLCGLKTEEEYKEETEMARRERAEKIRHDTEDQEYHMMWQLYHKYGGSMPTRFPTNVLNIAAVCDWDTPESVDILNNGVIFHVTKKDLQ